MRVVKLGTSGPMVSALGLGGMGKSGTGGRDGVPRQRALGSQVSDTGGITTMKFGIFYEMQLPRPWGPDSEWQLSHDALSQLELADKLGYDYAWVFEHH